MNARTRRKPDDTGRGTLGEFLRTEAAGGAALLLAAIVALIWANAGTGAGYESLWEHELTVDLGRISQTLDVRGWVNDGLMTLFFFLVGLEIKRELVTGELSDRKKATLPVAAALGGVAAPAIIYSVITIGSGFERGWAIPMATDIAFAVGALALVSRFVPSGIRVFLLALAIVDDIIAIAVIALFYAGRVSVAWLLSACAVIALTALVRSFEIKHELLFIASLVASWALLLRSGIHATLAGVAVAMLVPAREVGGREILRSLERYLHPWVAFLVVPLFALANAGVALDPGAIRFAVDQAVTWGVVAGLLIGKPLGITAGAAIAVKLRLAQLPGGVRWRQMIGVGMLGGIGFTVALILANLSFDSPEVLAATKVGILAASVAAAIAGCTALALASRQDHAGR